MLSHIRYQSSNLSASGGIEELTHAIISAYYCVPPAAYFDVVRGFPLTCGLQLAAVVIINFPLIDYPTDNSGLLIYSFQNIR